MQSGFTCYALGRFERREELVRNAEQYYRSMFRGRAMRDVPRSLLLLRNDNEATRALSAPKLRRAIGVIHRPVTERISHYYEADLPRQFDAIVYLDNTTALRGLEPDKEWERGVEEPPETFPSGI